MYENVEELENINEKQENAINLLISGKTIEEISRDLNININTIYRWKRQSKFRQTLKSKQDSVFEDISLKLGSIGTEAIDIIYNLMKNAVNENTKLKASIFVIDKLLQLRNDDIVKKIEEIEFVLSTGEYKK